MTIRPELPRPITDLCITPIDDGSLDPQSRLIYRFADRSDNQLGLFAASDLTGNAIVRVRIGFDRSVPPDTQSDNRSLAATEGARWTRVSDNLVDSTSDCAYLWIAQSAHPADEINPSSTYLTDVSVVERASIDASSSQSNIEVLPVTETLVIVAEYHTPESASQSIDQSASRLNVSSSSQSPDHGSHSSASSDRQPVDNVGGWRIGDLVDCMDTVNAWLEGTIVDIAPSGDSMGVNGSNVVSNGEPNRNHGGAVKVHYDGWLSSKWDEWIPLASRRLAKYHSFTGNPRSETAFKLKNEQGTLAKATNRLFEIHRTLLKLAQQQSVSQPANPELFEYQSMLPLTHPYYPLHQPLSMLLSADDCAWIISGENFKFVGSISISAVDEELCKPAVIYQSINAFIVTYLVHTECLMANKIVCELVVRLFGAHATVAHLYEHVTPQSFRDLPIEESLNDLFIYQSTDVGVPTSLTNNLSNTVYSSREAALRRMSPNHPTGAARPAIGYLPESQRGNLLPSSILVNLINQFGRLGGFDAIKKQLLSCLTHSPHVQTIEHSIPSSFAQSASSQLAPAITKPESPKLEINESSTKRSPIESVMFFIRFLSAIRFFFEQSFIQPYITSLSIPTVVKRQMQLLSDDELKAFDKTTFREVVSNVQSLLLVSGVADIKACNEFHDVMQLHLALRMINAQVLATRLEGIAMLESVIKSLDRSLSMHTRQTSSDNSARSEWVTTTNIAAFIEDHRIVDSLLGRDSHEQIVKRSPLILRFLAQQQKLQARHLDLLYQACSSKHEGVTRIVYELLAELSQVLSEDLLDTVYARIVEKPFAEYRDFDVLLVRNFTYHAVKNRLDALSVVNNTSVYGTIAKATGAVKSDVKNTKWYGLNVLWELSTDSTISPALQQQASSAIALLLSTSEFKSQLLVYLDKCLSTLSMSTQSPTNTSLNAVAPALLLAKSLLEKQPEVPARGALSRSDIVTQLEQQSKILSAVVDNLITYERTIVPTLAGSGTTSLATSMTQPLVMAVTPATVVGTGESSESGHMFQLNTRFQFLSFLLASSRIILSQQHIDAMWATFVPPPAADPHSWSPSLIHVTDSNLFFRWLSSNVEGRDPKDPKDLTAIGRKLARYVFAELLCHPSKLDMVFLTETGFDCFQCYFIYVNRDNEALLTFSKQVTVIAHKKLEGMEALWAIATSARHHLVSQLAVMLLTSLHLRLDFTATPKEKREIMKRFLDRCVSQISQTVSPDSNNASSSASSKGRGSKSEKRASGAKSSATGVYEPMTLSETSTAKLSALMQVLDMFLLRLQRGEFIDKPRFRVGQAVKATWKTQKTFYDARIRAINKDGTYNVQYDDGDVDERTNERNLRSLDRAADDAHMQHREAQVRGTVGHDDDEDNDAAYPRLILANDPKCFELLFKILGQPNAKLSQQASDLLNKLPLNADLAAQIRSLGSNGEGEGNSKKNASLSASAVPPDWMSLFPASSIPKLRYTLRVLRDYAIVAPSLQPQQGTPVSPAELASIEAARIATIRWDESFVMKGGFKHLYTLLMSVDDWTSDLGHLKCLESLLEFINLFLLLPTIRAPVHDVIDHAALSSKLLSLVQQSVCLANKLGEPAAVFTASRAPSLSSTTTLMVPVAVPIAIPIAVPVAVPARAQYIMQQELEVHSRIISHALSSLHLVLSPQPTLINQLLSLPIWAPLLRQGILSEHQAVRVNLTRGLLELSNSFPSLHQFLLPRLLAYLPDLDTVGSLHCSHEYFEMLTRLIERNRSDSDSKNNSSKAITEGDSSTAAAIEQQSVIQSPTSSSTGLYDAQKLLQVVRTKIASHPILESSASVMDPILCDLLSLAHHLAAGESRSFAESAADFVQDLLKFLFQNPTSASRASDLIQPPKLKSPKARETAFHCLYELARDSPTNGMLIAQFLMQFHMATMGPGTRRDDWQFEPRLEEKSVTNYLGLHNLGCICYMNAPLQQLFMIPSFRQCLFKIDEYKDATNEDMNESLIYQLQYLFAQLQESEQQAASPAGLCHAFKDLDGRPTDVRIQDDSGGFLQKLLDRLCMSTKSTSHERLIPSVLGGEFCHELIGRGECTHYRDRSEEFYGLSVEVQNKHTLEQSLDSFIEGELLDGGNQYKCDKCNKKVDTLKRACIRKLPPSLFFILKRFQLDYNTMETVKLNDRLEFPYFLDMRPYCKESLPSPNSNEPTKPDNPSEAPVSQPDEVRDDSYYQYVLRGVVVHTGSANGGHYYSFVQERGNHSQPDTQTDGSSDPISEAISGRWMKMNDSVVTYFDPKDIADECFGGVEEAAPANNQRGGNQTNKDGTNQVFEKYRNAYLVFYDRVATALPDVAAANEQVASRLATNQSTYQQTTQALTPSLNQRYRTLVSPNAPTANVITRSASSSLLSAQNNTNARFRAHVPDAMFSKIWKHNHDNWRDKAVFDTNYASFVLRTVWNVNNKVTTRLERSSSASTRRLSYDHDTQSALQTTDQSNINSVMEQLSRMSVSDQSPESPQTVERVMAQLAIRYVLTTVARSRVKDQLLTWFQVLCMFIQRDVVLSAWLLQGFAANDGSWVREFLLECPDAAVHSGIADLLSLACKNVIPLCLASFEASDSQSSVAREFGIAMLSQLPVVPLHWRQLDSYFRVLTVFAGVDRRCARWLASTYNLVARLLDFFLADASIHPELEAIPVSSVTHKRIRMQDEHSSFDSTHVIALLGELFQVSSQPAKLPVSAKSPDAMLPQPRLHPDDIPLSQEALALLLYPDLNNGFLVHVLQLATDRRKARHVGMIICALSQDNAEITEVLVSCIRKGLEWFDWHQHSTYYRCVGQLLGLEDSLTQQRHRLIARTLCEVIVGLQRYWKNTDIGIHYLLNFARRYPLFMRCIAEKPDTLLVLVHWMSTHLEPPATRSMYAQSFSSQNVSLTKGPEGLKQPNVSEPYGFPMRTKLALIESIATTGTCDFPADVEQEDLRVLKVGDMIDCCNSASKWCVAQVAKVDDQRAHVQYQESGPSWNEWIEFTDPRLAKLGTHTKPKRTQTNPNTQNQAQQQRRR